MCSRKSISFSSAHGCEARYKFSAAGEEKKKRRRAGEEKKNKNKKRRELFFSSPENPQRRTVDLMSSHRESTVSSKTGR
jgi:hypothetical protein